MPGIERFVDALLANIVFLICLLPLVGAALTLLSFRMNAMHVRSTALTNAGLTLSLTLLMVVNYEVSADDDSRRISDTQMVSAFGWFGDTGLSGARSESGDTPLLNSIEVQCAVGVDGISLWLLTLTSLLAFAAIVSVRTTTLQQSTLFYTLILTQQSLVLLLFAALDVVLFSIALHLSPLPLYFLIGRWGGKDRHSIARRHLMIGWGGSLAATAGLISIGVVAARVSPPLNLAIPYLMNGFPKVVATHGGSDWALMEPWVLLAIVVGFAARVQIVPFHAGLIGAEKQVPIPVRILLVGLFPLIGLYGLARFAAPLLAASEAEWTATFRIVAIVGSIYCGMLACLRRDVDRSTKNFWLSSLHLAVAGVLTLSSNGIIGGLLYGVGLSLAMCAYRLAPASAHGGTVWTFALVGIPGSAGFAGLLLILLGLFEVSVPMAVGGVLAWGFATSTLAFRFRRGVEAGELGESAGNALPACRSSQRPDATHATQMAVSLSMVVLVVSIGVNPQFFTSRTAPSVRRILNIPKVGLVAEQSSNKGDQTDNKQDGRIEINYSGVPGNDKPNNSDNHHDQSGN